MGLASELTDSVGAGRDSYICRFRSSLGEVVMIINVCYRITVASDILIFFSPTPMLS